MESDQRTKTCRMVPWIDAWARDCSAGERLAAMAGTRPGRNLDGDRPARRVAARGPAGQLADRDARPRLRNGCRRRRCNLRAGHKGWSERGLSPARERWRRGLGPEAGAALRPPEQRGRATLRADRSRRLALRPQRDGRSGEAREKLGRRRLAVQHAEPLRQPEHPLGHQRVSACRSRSRIRHAGRQRRRDCGTLGSRRQHDLAFQRTGRRRLLLVTHPARARGYRGAARVYGRGRSRRSGRRRSSSLALRETVDRERDQHHDPGA